MANIKIFLTNLGKYNEGELVGKWVDLPISEEDLNKVLEDIGIDGEEYEETFITDFESDFGNLTIGEYENLEELNELADRAELLDDYEVEIVDAYLENGSDLEEALDNYEDATFWYGCSDMTEVAEQYAEETGLLDSIPEDLRYYFDFEAFGRDMDIEGTFIFTNSGCVEIP